MQEYNFTIDHFLLKTTDDLLLPALYYRKKRENRSPNLSIYIHGAGSSSIIRWPNLTIALADQLTSKNCDLLTFNNRGSGFITKIDSEQNTYVLGGMAYEQIRNGIIDIE